MAVRYGLTEAQKAEHLGEEATRRQLLLINYLKGERTRDPVGFARASREDRVLDWVYEKVQPPEAGAPTTHVAS